MTLTDLETIVRRHMLLADPHIIRLLCAFVAVTKINSINPPLWLFIVGPPSGGKSRLLKALAGSGEFVAMDELTTNTFASGMRGRDGLSNSLLDNLADYWHSILLFKDFTTLIAKEQESRGVIIAQMRKIYDGDFVKKTGAGINTAWEGRLSVLAGVTEEIYPSMGMFAAMGERFLMYSLKQPDRKAVTEVALAQSDDQPGDKEMKAAFAEYLNGLKIPEKAGGVDTQTKNQLIELSEFVTRARTPVKRDRYGRGHSILQVFQPESPPRFAKQVKGLGLGLQALNGGELTDDDRLLLCDIALDCIPPMRRICLRMLTRYEEADTRELTLALKKYDTDSIREHLYDLAAMDMVERRDAGNRDRWKLKTQYRELMSRYEKIEMGEGLPEIVEETPMTEKAPLEGRVEVVEI